MFWISKSSHVSFKGMPKTIARSVPFTMAGSPPARLAVAPGSRAAHTTARYRPYPVILDLASRERNTGTNTGWRRANSDCTLHKGVIQHFEQFDLNRWGERLKPTWRRPQ